MNKQRPMYGPLLKLERANHHLKELEKILNNYIRANIKSMKGKINRKTRQHVPYEFVPELPHFTPTIIGDIVHNLRVSLDHAYWILVEANGGKFSRGVKFPFFDTKNNLERTLEGYLEASLPNRTVINFIVTKMQPYEGGELHLYDLHRLDITDKHKLLLPTYRQLEINGTLSVGTKTLTGTKGSNFIITNPNEPMFSVVGPVKFTGNLHDAITILFGPGEMEKKPVQGTLKTLSKNIHDSILQLETYIVHK